MAGEERAAAPRQVGTESGEEREQADPPLVEDLPGKGGRCSAEGAAEREGAPWGHTGDLGEEAAKRRNVGEGPQAGGEGAESPRG